MPDNYNPSDHYWLVVGKIYSSKLDQYVSKLPASFGGVPTTILSEHELSDVVFDALSWRPAFGSLVAANRIAAGKARAKRNDLIAASDWTQLADTPLTAAQKAAWAIYRQALRDVTAQAGFPSSVVWPVVPA